VPWRMGSLLNITVTVVSSNVAVHPTSHNCPIDKRECWLSCGKRYAVLAEFGMIGIWSCVATESIVLPFGMVTEIDCSMLGWLLGCMLVISVLLKKCPVQPVSAMVCIAVEFCVRVVGGPKDGVGVSITLLLLWLVINIPLVGGLGSPRPHVLGFGGGTKTGFSLRCRWIMLPPAPTCCKWWLPFDVLEQGCGM
jgi:hypothetical protein